MRVVNANYDNCRQGHDNDNASLHDASRLGLGGLRRKRRALYNPTWSHEDIHVHIFVVESECGELIPARRGTAFGRVCQRVCL